MDLSVALLDPLPFSHLSSLPPVQEVSPRLQTQIRDFLRATWLRSKGTPESSILRELPSSLRCEYSWCEAQPGLKK
jgi:hypothetical protein